MILTKLKFLVIALFFFLSSVVFASNNHIKVGTSPDYPPFEFKKNGKIVGFDIDLINSIAQKLELKIEIQELDFASLIPALHSGQVDCVISGVTVTKDRLKNVDSSDIYYRTSIAAISKTNKNIKHTADLANKIIGAQLGSTMQEFAKTVKNQYENVTIVSMANNLHLLQELNLERIDVLLLEESQVQEIVASFPNLTAHIFPKTGEGYAIIFAKSSPLIDKFNTAISELKNDNILDELENKWLTIQETKKSSLTDSLKYIPQGVFVTLEYALLSVFFGFIFGSILAFMKVSNNFLLKLFANFYTSVFRGTPLLLQLFIVYFTLPELLAIKISPFIAGIIAFSLNSAAYVSENIRAGIQTIDRGQFEAAKALAIPYWTSMRYVILPQALRNIWPSLVNEAINMVKESSIISVLGVADIMRRANIIAAEQYNYLTPLLIAAGCYYILVSILSFFASFLERKLKKL